MVLSNFAKKCLDMMVIAMNNDFSEMFEKMEKRKLRKYRLYMANIVYQWINIAAMAVYLVAPFVLKIKVGPITYFSNLILIPLFSAMLFNNSFIFLLFTLRFAFFTTIKYKASKIKLKL